MRLLQAEGAGFELVMDKNTTVESCHEQQLHPKVLYRVRFSLKNKKRVLMFLSGYVPCSMALIMPSACIHKTPDLFAVQTIMHSQWNALCRLGSTVGSESGLPGLLPRLQKVEKALFKLAWVGRFAFCMRITVPFPHSSKIFGPEVLGMGMEEGACCQAACLMLQFRRLADLERLPVNTRTDVAGILDRVGSATLVSTKYGNTLRKRSLVLKDDSLCTVELTLWGDPADGIGAELEEVCHNTLLSCTLRIACTLLLCYIMGSAAGQQQCHGKPCM